MKSLLVLTLAVALAETGLAVLAPESSGLIEGIKAETGLRLKEHADWIGPLTGAPDRFPKGGRAAEISP